MPWIGWPGNALRFFRNPVAYMMHLRDRFGNVARLVDRNHPTLIIDSKPNDAATFFAFGAEQNREILTQQEVFLSRRTRAPQTPAFDRLSNHLLFINGKKHADRRRLITPIFSYKHLSVYHESILRQCGQTLGRWREGERIDLLAQMHELAIHIAMRTFFGLEPTGELDALSTRTVRLVNMLTWPPAMIPVRLPGTPHWKLCRLAEQVTAQIQSEIDRRRAQGAAGEDFLSTLIRSQQREDGLTDDELVGQTFLMFLVGHDTTACALTWTLFLLAQHPDVASSLLDELDNALSGEPPAYEELSKLPVLDRVIRESLRVLSPAVMFPRFVARDTALGSFEVPAGSEVLYSPYVTHHDPMVFDRPERFDPDRWLHIKPSPYAYLPFGQGRRNCIGASFGLMQLRLILAMVLQRYRLQVLPGTRIDLKVVAVMAPKGGLPMVIHRQDRQFHKSPAEVSGYIREMVELN